MTDLPFDDESSRARKGVFVVLTQAGIASRDDRLEIASDILGKDVESFTKLTKDDLLDLHFGLQAWKKIQNMRMAVGALLTEAEDIVQEIHEIDLSEHTKRLANPLPHQEDEID